MTFIKKITNHVGVPKISPTQLDNFDHDEDAENRFLLSKVGTVNNGQLKFHKNPIISKYPTFTWTIHCSS